MDKRVYSVCLLMLVLGWAVGARAFDLTILHTNDVHAALGGVQADGSPCYAAQCAGGAGGAVLLQQAVAAERAAKKNCLLLDAGDQAQGTLFYSLFESEPSAKVMNILGYDAMVPGNHEFDNACAGFQKFSEQLDAPLVAANMRYAEKYNPVPDYAPWVIIERSGRKIGIVGIITPETSTASSPCTAVHFDDPVAALQKAVNALQARGVNIIIALTHYGIEHDKALANKVTGVDIIVGGHSHTLLSNKQSNAQGPYPVVEHSPSNQPVLVVTNVNGLRSLGVLDVTFDDAGKLVAWHGEPVLLVQQETQTPHAALAALLEEYAVGAQDLLHSPVGTIAAALPKGQSLLEPDIRCCRQQECATGNLVADALLWAGKADNAQFALVNGGGLRSSLPVGMVTVGNIMATIPFDGDVVTGVVSGTVLKAALEQGLRRYAEGVGAFPQVAGLHIEADIQRPAGKRLLSVRIAAADGSWQLIQDSYTYRMVTLDFLAQGGDGYAMLATKQWRSVGKSTVAVVQAYLQACSPLRPRLEHRISVH